MLGKGARGMLADHQAMVAARQTGVQSSPRLRKATAPEQRHHCWQPLVLVLGFLLDTAYAGYPGSGLKACRRQLPAAAQRYKG